MPGSCPHIHSYMHACIHTYIHTFQHTYIHSNIHTYILTHNTRTCCICVHLYVHTTYAHAYIGSHTFIHALHKCVTNVSQLWRTMYLQHCHGLQLFLMVKLPNLWLFFQMRNFKGLEISQFLVALAYLKVGVRMCIHAYVHTDIYIYIYIYTCSWNESIFCRSDLP
jgi:hypothetical protein